MIIHRCNPIKPPLGSQGFSGLHPISPSDFGRRKVVRRSASAISSRPPLLRRAVHDLKHGCCSSGGGISGRPASSGFLLGDEDRERVGAGISGSGEGVDLRRLATELCRDMPASKSFQSYLGPSPEPLSVVLMRSVVANDGVRPDLLARDFLIIAALVDSASSSRSSAVILRFLLGFSQARPGSCRRVSSSCCLRRRRFE